jgi:multicomponent Na+:H+ antiporter subunit E
MKFLKQVIFLIIIWVILSGQFGLFFLSVGVISSFLVAFFLRESNIAKKFKPYFILKFLFLYLPWLIWQVILSSIYVTKQVWKLEIDIKDTKENIIKIKNKQENDLLSTIFANSITLTPGTATLFIDNNKLYIHCLTQDTKSGVFDIEKKLIYYFG